jgi:hypothetical protein
MNLVKECFCLFIAVTFLGLNSSFVFAAEISKGTKEKYKLASVDTVFSVDTVEKYHVKGDENNASQMLQQKLIDAMAEAFDTVAIYSVYSAYSIGLTNLVVGRPHNLSSLLMQKFLFELNRSTLFSPANKNLYFH